MKLKDSFHECPHGMISFVKKIKNHLNDLCSMMPWPSSSRSPLICGNFIIWGVAFRNERLLFTAESTWRIDPDEKRTGLACGPHVLVRGFVSGWLDGCMTPAFRCNRSQVQKLVSSELPTWTSLAVYHVRPRTSVRGLAPSIAAHVALAQISRQLESHYFFFPYFSLFSLFLSLFIYK